MTPPDEELSLTQELTLQARILGSFVGVFWLVELIDQFVFRGNLDRFGIAPRAASGLQGIFFAPFLHGSWPHLISNTVPFVVLGWFVMIQETADFIIVTVFSLLTAGLGTWLFGATGSVHVGASSLIYGYLGFLLLRGYFERNQTSVMLSILVFFLYGGVVWGVLPTQAGVSWEGHLFGFVGGVLAARYLSKQRRRHRDR
ncbi:MAG: rhomboid family intramembrane serine protease [Spirulina sp. SIO3F2]|nr:rhomboid family intramembrane serine protease [Spirulina sp. SIO3F2]